MRTITIQIGNSDDKLTQKEWSDFVREVHESIQRNDFVIHFSGTSSGEKPWQNACWVASFSGDDHAMFNFTTELRCLCALYRQDSIALTDGETHLVS